MSIIWQVSSSFQWVLPHIITFTFILREKINVSFKILLWYLVNLQIFFGMLIPIQFHRWFCMLIHLAKIVRSFAGQLKWCMSGFELLLCCFVELHRSGLLVWFLVHLQPCAQPLGRSSVLRWKLMKTEMVSQAAVWYF